MVTLMTRKIDAIFENGVFRPLEPVQGLEERAQVRLSVEMPSNGQDLSKCIGSLPDADAADMLRIIESEFERVDLRDWS